MTKDSDKEVGLIINHKRLSGWGRITAVDCEIWQPHQLTDIDNVIDSINEYGVIGRGCGRSYGDASTNEDGRVVDMTSLNTVENFDPESCTIICQSGVTMGQLVKQFLPYGIVPPVCPGTGFVTVGGAIAHDIHGKNHHKHGSFGDHVIWIDLLLASGEVRRISIDQYPDLFLATIGGGGLTGLILRAAFNMLRINTNAVKVYERPLTNLDQFIEALKIADIQSTYSVGWIDASAGGRQLGRGILITAEPAEGFKPVRKRISINIPFNLPCWTLNHLSVSAFNTFYYHRIGREKTHFVDFERFVFPLDALLNWNRLYGSRGIYQFQCVIPHKYANAALREILTLSAASGATSPLAVIKTLSKKGRGYISFPMPGVTLALDFQCTERSAELIKCLYEITLSNEGRVYLAKDQCLEPEQFRRMYPDVQHFEKILQEIDPGKTMQSDMSRRLKLNSIL